MHSSRRLSATACLAKDSTRCSAAWPQQPPKREPEREHSEKTQSSLHKKKRKFFGGFTKSLYFCIRNREAQGRSPVGLERCSHIAEVIGSSPIVPTSRKSKTPQKAATHSVFASQPFVFSGSFHPLGAEVPAASNHSPHPPNKTVPACRFAKLPPLDCKTATFGLQNWQFWNAELAVLERRTGSFGTQNWQF